MQDMLNDLFPGPDNPNNLPVLVLHSQIQDNLLQSYRNIHLTLQSILLEIGVGLCVALMSFKNPEQRIWLFFMMIGFVAFYFRDVFSKKKGEHLFKSLFLNALFVIFSLALIYLFQKILFRLVSHSNLNLLRFSFNPSFLLLHSGVVCFISMVFTALCVQENLLRLYG